MSVPAPRRPSALSPRSSAAHAAAPARRPARGRHAAARRRPLISLRHGITPVVDAVGHVGTAVTLAALLVLAGAFGGLTDGSPADSPTVTATLDGPTGD